MTTGEAGASDKHRGEGVGKLRRWRVLAGELIVDSRKLNRSIDDFVCDKLWNRIFVSNAGNEIRLKKKRFWGRRGANRSRSSRNEL